ncbi:hypothetical protein ACJ73_00840 [Blastomyces percursus]|uniref:C2H2-type domain-containing protein n=1 Tax=Blastomyces percursus TaxID=1658174 RepID=A0A1J9QI49_9EURO|nr:hypothetical protein ACJ73_00840 [Blastomyces percursus]
MYSSGRVGEYVESTARLGSGRGLHVPQDLTILVICNRKNQPEVIIRPTRDAKGMSEKKNKHPQHPMAEDIESLPLYLNPVLEPLAICLARGLFRDFKTADEIFALEPPPGEYYELVLGENFPGTPFFEVMSDKGPTGRILNASWLDDGLAKLGRRGGYDNRISCHDIRAEALVRADENGYSKDELMKFAGHGDPRMFFESYMPATSSVGGVENILGLARRRDISMHFRVRQELEDSPECAKLNVQIGELTARIQAASTDDMRQKLQDQRQNLYKQKHQLLAIKLDTWQLRLPKERKPGTTEHEDNTPLYHWTWFERVAHLMPERKRLSRLLPLSVPLRSSEGRQALEDMIAICRQKSPVSDHPSLKPVNGCCPAHGCSMEVESLPAKKRWKHIYRCLKRSLQKQHGFASLCFICCSWFMQEAEFAQHCQYHLDRPETIPIQYGYLEVRGMIASPGYCPRRLGDASKSATERLKAFLDPQSLKRDMDKYYEVLEDDKPMECGSLHCDVLFSSVLELQYHYQDVHCIPVPRKRSNVKPEEKSGVAGSPQDGDNTSSGLEFHITTSGSFKRFKRKRTESSDSENIDLPAKRHNYGSACGGLLTSFSHQTRPHLMGLAIKPEKILPLEASTMVITRTMVLMLLTLVDLLQ